MTDSAKKLISIVTPCYNEEENVHAIFQETRKVMADLKDYEYEHIFIDNASQDKTVPYVKEIAAQHKNVKLIVNSRNFGPVRSPYYGLIQGKGDAVVIMSADLQDPPEVIKAFVKKWEEGNKIVVGIVKNSKENAFMNMVRKSYYVFIKKFSEIHQIKNFNGFGLYDKQFIETIKKYQDPYPYFRGLISDVGFKRAEVAYTKPKREKGETKTNFYSLYDMAMLGLVNHSKVPLRIAVFIGFITGFISFCVGFIYLVYKLIFWSSFQLGIAPLVIGFFFLFSLLLFFIGIIGEYIGAIYTQVRNRPLVIEEERINFD